MKLHSSQFEKDLKRLVKQTIRSSPELKREHRRVKRYRKQLNSIWLWRLAISLLLGFCVWNIQLSTGHLTTALAGIGIFLLAALCFRISSLWTKLYSSTDQFVLMQLPLTTGTVFRWQLKKYFLESLFLAVDLVVMLAALAWQNDFTIWKWLCIPLFIAVAWFNVIGLAAFCALRLPRTPFQIISVGLIAMGVVLFFGRSVVGPLALRLLDGNAWEINHLLPTSWALAPFELLNEPHHWWELFAWLPVAFVIGNLKSCLRLLRERMIYQEVMLPMASDQVPGEEFESGPITETPKQLGPTEIEGIIESGLFLKKPGHPLRWILEQKLWNWLNPRERALAEFIHPSGLFLSATWKRIYITLLITILLVGLTGLFSSLMQLSSLGLGAFIVFCMAIASIANHGRTFTTSWVSGVNVPMYASYGIGFSELARFFFKYAVVQIPLLIGVFVILGGVSAWCLKQPVELGLIFGFKTAGLIFASRFILVVFAFSSGTNDTTQFRLSAIVLVMSIVVLGIGFLGLGAAGLFVPMLMPSFLLWGGALIDAWMFFWVYGLFYRHCRFDLMSIPKQ